MMTFDSSLMRVSAVDPVGAASGASANMLGKPDAVSDPLTVANSAIGAGNAAAAQIPAPASTEQVDKFKTMMDRATFTVRSDRHVSSGTSAIANVVDSQDAAFNQLATSVNELQQNAGTMDQSAFTAQMVQMQFQVADAMARIELGVGFAQGGKSAVQTLMKNQ